MATLRERLAAPGAFVVAAEVVTSRGVITAERGRGVLRLARELAEDPRIDVLSITDNPGGHAMLAPDTLGTDLVARGQEVIIHLACKDWNRNALESRGWKLASEGFRNVLCMSGDYPVTGHEGLAKPVFDIDSVGLLKLFSDLNAGLVDERRPEVPRRHLRGGGQLVVRQLLGRVEEPVVDPVHVVEQVEDVGRAHARIIATKAATRCQESAACDARPKSPARRQSGNR